MLAVPDRGHQDKRHRGAVIIFPSDGADSAPVTLQSPTQYDHRGCRPQVLMESRPRKTGSLCAFFGDTMIVEGKTVVVGEPFEKVDGVAMAGAAYRWTLPREPSESSFRVDRLIAPEPQPRALFGAAFGFQGDNLIIGSPRAAVGDKSVAGSVYLYSMTNISKAPSVVMPQQPTEFGQFGASLATGDSGILAVGGGASRVEIFNGLKGYSPTGILDGFSPEETPQLWLLGRNLAVGDRHEFAVLQPSVKPFDFQSATSIVVNKGAIKNPNSTSSFVDCEGVFSDPDLTRLMSGWALTDGSAAQEDHTMKVQCVPGNTDNSPANFTGSTDFTVKLSFARRRLEEDGETVIRNEMCVQPNGAGNAIAEACCVENVKDDSVSELLIS
jgi:hypothetical protein